MTSSSLHHDNAPRKKRSGRVRLHLVVAIVILGLLTVSPIVVATEEEEDAERAAVRNSGNNLSLGQTRTDVDTLPDRHHNNQSPSFTTAATAATIATVVSPKQPRQHLDQSDNYEDEDIDEIRDGHEFVWDLMEENQDNHDDEGGIAASATVARELMVVVKGFERQSWYPFYFLKFRRKIKTCARRTNVPVTGQRCPPKLGNRIGGNRDGNSDGISSGYDYICFFGTQFCQSEEFGGAAGFEPVHPTLRCDCINRFWECQDWDPCDEEEEKEDLGCPVETPRPGDSCQTEQTCSYGREFCCGKQYPSFQCQCFDGTFGCFYVDACLDPNCWDNPPECPLAPFEPLPEAGVTNCSDWPVDRDCVYEEVCCCGGLDCVPQVRCRCNHDTGLVDECSTLDRRCGSDDCPPDEIEGFWCPAEGNESSPEVITVGEDCSCCGRCVDDWTCLCELGFYECSQTVTSDTTCHCDDECPADPPKDGDVCFWSDDLMCSYGEYCCCSGTTEERCFMTFGCSCVENLVVCLAFPSPACADEDCPDVVLVPTACATDGDPTTGLICDDGFSCQDVPNDGCDPLAGSVDCHVECQPCSPQPNEKGALFLGSSAEECARVNVFCPPNTEEFSNDCGCGCVGIPEFCGGFTGFQCPNDYRCIDNPNDGCDPSQGGADCTGSCEECTWDEEGYDYLGISREECQMLPEAEELPCSPLQVVFRWDGCGCGCKRDLTFPDDRWTCPDEPPEVGTPCDDWNEGEACSYDEMNCCPGIVAPVPMITCTCNSGLVECPSYACPDCPPPPAPPQCGGEEGLSCDFKFTCEIDDTNCDPTAADSSSSCEGICVPCPSEDVACYVGFSREECAGLSYWCPLGSQPFLVDCGCGCDSSAPSPYDEANNDVTCPSTDMPPTNGDECIAIDGNLNICRYPIAVCCDGVTISEKACFCTADGGFLCASNDCPTCTDEPGFCGGIAGIACPDGYECRANPLDYCTPPTSSDLAGICCPEADSEGVSYFADCVGLSVESIKCDAGLEAFYSVCGCGCQPLGNPTTTTDQPATTEPPGDADDGEDDDESDEDENDVAQEKDAPPPPPCAPTIMKFPDLESESVRTDASKQTVIETVRDMEPCITKIQFLPEGSPVTMDYRVNRLRIFYDPATFLIKGKPRAG